MNYGQAVYTQRFNKAFSFGKVLPHPAFFFSLSSILWLLTTVESWAVELVAVVLGGDHEAFRLRRLLPRFSVLRNLAVTMVTRSLFRGKGFGSDSNTESVEVCSVDNRDRSVIDRWRDSACCIFMKMWCSKLIIGCSKLPLRFSKCLYTNTTTQHAQRSGLRRFNDYSCATLFHPQNFTKWLCHQGSTTFKEASSKGIHHLVNK